MLDEQRREQYSRTGHGALPSFPRRTECLQRGIALCLDPPLVNLVVVRHLTRVTLHLLLARPVVIFIFQESHLVQQLRSLSDDLLLPADALLVKIFKILHAKAKLLIKILRKETGGAHVVLRLFVIPEYFVVLILNWHLLDVIGLLQVLHLGAPADLPHHVLVVIKRILSLEVDVAGQVASVVGLTLECHHLLPRETYGRICHQVLQFLHGLRIRFSSIRQGLLGERRFQILYLFALWLLGRLGRRQVLQPQPVPPLELVDHVRVQPHDVPIY